MSNTEVYGTDPIRGRYEDWQSTAWLYLIEKGMTAVPNNGPISIGANGLATREPIGPFRNRDGRYVNVSASLRDGSIIHGLLCFRDSGRMVLAADGGAFITFHTDDALSVAVTYLDPPEDETP